VTNGQTTFTIALIEGANKHTKPAETNSEVMASNEERKSIICSHRVHQWSVHRMLYCQAATYTLTELWKMSRRCWACESTTLDKPYQVQKMVNNGSVNQKCCLHSTDSYTPICKQVYSKVLHAVRKTDMSITSCVSDPCLVPTLGDTLLLWRQMEPHYVHI
jgi:hypothetical protein